MDIKLIIWDLDDTLWTGTLADGDTVRLNEFRANAIRTLNHSGVISSICSKNDREQAVARLSDFDLWDEFVFARIEFTPKGTTVRDMIEDMQLRPANVLFVDDNVHNLNEVKHAIPSINVIDATSPDCDRLLQTLIDVNKHSRKSRLAEYRALEQRSSDRKNNSSSQEEFLRSCGIRICLVLGGENLDFAQRIEELVNRSNQLNYTKSRIPEGSATDLILGHPRKTRVSVFVWDKYGYHGLVGFACVQQEKKLDHFVFSCRVMHMGIEQWTLAWLKQNFENLDTSSLKIEEKNCDWISEERFSSPETRALILSKETKRQLGGNANIRIMADCQTGAIAHYAGLNDLVGTDLDPRFFRLRKFGQENDLDKIWPRFLVYGAFVEYKDKRALRKKRGWTLQDYSHCAGNFAAIVKEQGGKALVILPPSTRGIKFQKKIGVTRKRVIQFNRIWKKLAESGSGVQLLDLTTIPISAGDIADVRHYNVSMLKKIGERVGQWFHDVSGSAKAA